MNTRIYLLDADTSFQIIGTLLVYLAILVIIFLIFREFVMWYWKVNERITLQNNTNDLLRELIETLNSKDIGIRRIQMMDNSESANSQSNKLGFIDGYRKKSMEELNMILNELEGKTQDEIFATLKILKQRSAQPPYSKLEDIAKKYGMLSVDELWKSINEFNK
jgi:hypothetical protein